MGFFKNTAENISENVANGDTASLERAADAIVYAMLEGSGTPAQNIAAITEQIPPRK